MLNVFKRNQKKKEKPFSLSLSISYHSDPLLYILFEEINFRYLILNRYRYLKGIVVVAFSNDNFSFEKREKIQDEIEKKKCIMKTDENGFYHLTTFTQLTFSFKCINQ